MKPGEIRANKKIVKLYISTNTRIPKFYHLIKTHKVSPDLKIRPIVSYVETPFYKISWLITQMLNVLLKDVPAHLASSSQLIERLDSCTPEFRAKFNYPFSLDVEAMYPSIDPQKAINNLRTILDEKDFNFHGFTSSEICHLLETLTKHFCFMFNGSMFKQKRGLPMGAPTSGLLAILFMDSLEKRHIHLQSIGLYSRYIDDIFILTTSEQEAKEIFDKFNTTDINIKFTIEYPTSDLSSNTLSLLDTQLTINEDGSYNTNFYKKKAKSSLFVNYKSALPLNGKVNYINNERNRIDDKTSSLDQKITNQNKFNEILEINNYPKEIIKKSSHIRQKRSRQSKNKNTSKNYNYLSMPFISDSFNSEVRNMFKKENINIRISHRSYTLRNKLAKSTNTRNIICTKNDCYLKNNLCLRKNIVYEIKCNKCNNCYIGSTIRELHIRVSEHLKSSSSSIYKHLISCNNIYNKQINEHPFEVKILACENDPINLRIKESLLIRKHRPLINAKEEQCQFNSFIF